MSPKDLVAGKISEVKNNKNKKKCMDISYVKITKY
jgi:hypothetical protein